MFNEAMIFRQLSNVELLSKEYEGSDNHRASDRNLNHSFQLASLKFIRMFGVVPEKDKRNEGSKSHH